MSYRGISGYYPLRNPTKIVNKKDLIMISIPKLNEMFGTNFENNGGNVALIKYRSKLEEKVLYFLDTNETIKHWGYECVQIPYVYEGKSHTYHVDLYVEKKDGTKELWEVKPYSIATKEPTSFIAMREEYKKNDAKWEYAREWCKTQGFTFRVITD